MRSSPRAVRRGPWAEAVGGGCGCSASPPESAPAFAKKPSKQVPTTKPPLCQRRQQRLKRPRRREPEELAAGSALDAEEESLAAEMEALAVKEASEATGASVEQLQRRAERDMRMRIWAAMDPDHVLEFQALGALRVEQRKRRRASSELPAPAADADARGLGCLRRGLRGPARSRLARSYWWRWITRSSRARDNPELKERVRVIPGSSLGLRAVGRLGLDLGDGRLRLLGQAGLGYAMHRSSLKHEQYTIDSEGFAVAGSGVAIQDSIIFPWAGPEVSGSVGAAYRLVGTSWRLLGKVQWQQTLLGNVQSFVTGQGAQSTLGLAVGVSGTF